MSRDAGYWFLDTRFWILDTDLPGITGDEAWLRGDSFLPRKKNKNNHDHLLRLDERDKGQNKNIFFVFLKFSAFVIKNKNCLIQQ